MKFKPLLSPLLLVTVIICGSQCLQVVVGGYRCSQVKVGAYRYLILIGGRR